VYQEEPVCEWPTNLASPAEGVASTSQLEAITAPSLAADRPNKLKKQKSQIEGDKPAVETLLARIADLEQALIQANSQGASNLVPKAENSIGTPPLTSGPSAPPSSLGSPHPHSSQQGEPTDARKILNQSSSNLPSPSAPTSLVSRYFPQDRIGLTVPLQFWTAWPFDLPPLSVVRPLCEVALSMIQTSYILSPDSFFHALALPPTDPRFPSTALLHAMCTLGSMMSPLPAHSNEYWRSAPSPSVYHFRCAKAALADYKMHTILDNCRASLLLTMYSFAVEQFVDVWQLVGTSARSLAPAGLNVSCRRSHV